MIRAAIAASVRISSVFVSVEADAALGSGTSKLSACKAVAWIAKNDAAMTKTCFSMR